MGRRSDLVPVQNIEQTLIQYQQALEASLTRLVRQVGTTGQFEAMLGDGNGRIIVPQAEQSLPRTFFVRKVDNFNNPTDVLEAVNEWDGLVYSNNQPEIPVTCARKAGKPYVAIIGPGDPITSYAVAGNATNLQFELFKAKQVTMSQVVELRLMPGDGTEIKVSEGAWWVGNTLYYTHEKVLGDLASYIPVTAGKAKYVMVGIDIAGTMQVTDGDEFNIAALPRPAESGVNTVAEGVAGLGHVRLHEGLTQLAKTDIVPRHAAPRIIGANDGIYAGFFGGRLTPVSGDPTPTADQTAVTTVYCAPTDQDGNALDTGYAKLFNTTLGEWQTHQWEEISASVPSTTNTPYDVFFYHDGADYRLEFVAWTNDTTRATALGTQDGVKVMASDHSKLWIGKIRTTGVSGQTESSATTRYISNEYNQVQLRLYLHDDTNLWTTTSTTFEQLRGQTSNKVSFIQSSRPKQVWLLGGFNTFNTAASTFISVGIDSTTVSAADTFIGGGGTSTLITAMFAYHQIPSEGEHEAPVLQKVQSGTSTIFGDNGASVTLKSAMTGHVWG